MDNEQCFEIIKTQKHGHTRSTRCIRMTPPNDYLCYQHRGIREQKLYEIR